MFSPSSLCCFFFLVFLCQAALGSLHTQTVTLYPLSSTQDFMYMNTQTLTHTHTHISPSSHAVPSCCYCNRAPSSPFYVGCNCHSCSEGQDACAFLNVRWSTVVARSLQSLEAVLDLWLFWLERYKHGGHVLQGLAESSAQAGLDSAGGSPGRWSHWHQRWF